MKNTLRLTVPLGIAFDRLHCPVCGKAVFEPDTPCDAPNCAHVQWVYLGETGEFTYTTPAVQAAIDELKQAEEDDEVESLKERFEATWSSNTRVSFEITTGGMACGPVWSTISVGVEYMPDSAGD